MQWHQALIIMNMETSKETTVHNRANKPSRHNQQANINDLNGHMK